MPLQSIKLKADILAKLKRRIRALIAKDILHPTTEIDHSYGIGFCMNIQIVPKKQIDSLSFGKPEGIRVFIQSKNSIIAAADFLYGKKNMKLSYLHYGHGLKLLVASLNKLEKRYKRHKDIYTAELIYFLLSNGLYILIKSRKQRQFYQSTHEKLSVISSEKIKKQVTNILADCKPVKSNQ
jgi:hypothetical protein